MDVSIRNEEDMEDGRLDEDGHEDGEEVPLLFAEK
jgi:hypothetical protein